MYVSNARSLPVLAVRPHIIPTRDRSLFQLESSLRRICTVAVAVEGGRAGGAEYADALTRLLEAAAAVVERARLATATAAPGLLPAALAIIQPAVLYMYSVLLPGPRHYSGVSDYSDAISPYRCARALDAWPGRWCRRMQV